MLTVDLTVKNLIISASGFYLLSFFFALFSLLRYLKGFEKFSVFQKFAIFIFSTGWLVNLAVFIINWVIAQNPPFGNMYHVMSFLPLCLLPLYLYVKYIQKLDWLLPYFVISAVLHLVGTLFMGQEIVWNRMPALQSPWFVPHVSTYMLSYGLATVAFLLIFPAFLIIIVIIIVRFVINLLKKFDIELLYGELVLDILNFIDKLEKNFTGAAYNIMLISFPFMTFGMFSGALWAEEAWGAYWTWDIKEVWSLITWSLYLIYFHCRLSRDIRKWQHLVHIFAFAALLITFFVINLLPKITSLHSYAR